MVRARRCAGAALVAAILVTVFGCGASGPKTYPVKGKVVVKNGQVGRIAGGYVHMESVGEPKVKGAGQIEDDGQFAMACFVNDKAIEGMPQGEYVAWVEPQSGEDKPVNEDDKVVIRKGDLLMKYRAASTSGLKYKVAPGPNDVTVEVEVKK